MNNQTDYTQLHEALVRLKEEGPDKRSGLCANLGALPSGAWWDFKGLCKAWPLFSGDGVYPVPACEGSDPEFMYFDTSEIGCLWDTSTEYGRLRWQLLDWLIEQTKPATGVDPSQVEALNELAADAQELKMGY